MDPAALVVLEWPAIAERLAAAASTPAGEGLARALRPSSDPGEVARRQALTSEAVALLELAAAPSLAGVEDIRDSAARAGRGGVLDPADLHVIAGAVRVAAEARRVVDAGEAELLQGLAAGIDPALVSLAAEIERCVTSDGSDLSDTASPLLRRLRSELRAGRNRAAEEVARLARAGGLQDALQETFVSERAGRPVLAVKASARARVAGIVHDTSGSGQTLFIEPFAVVELNNRLAETAGAEREEAARILAALSALVAEQSVALVALVVATAEIDLVLAAGTLSRRWRGARVEVSDQVRLVAARHPLLDAATAVPVDLELGDLRAVIVSGPNAGGKTVALKTLGLAALLHQAGLWPPAETAALPVFDQVLADIGDRQSIEMNLSTFSGHVERLVATLHAATDRSLVLLDEVAAGTDPVEGSALAQALLAHLSRQARLTVATTHYPELTEWASTSAGAANAATGVDPSTSAPLYRIALGRPGTSHALRIAERLGLPHEIAADARLRITPERLRTAGLLAEAEAAAAAAVEARGEAEREREDAAQSTQRARERESALEAEVEATREARGQARQEALADAERDLASAKEELTALRAEIRAARSSERARRRAASTSERHAEGTRDRQLGAAAARVRGAEDAIRSAAEPLRAVAPLAVGDPVEAADAGVRGTIASIDDGEAVVVGPGGLRVRVALARLSPSAERPSTGREQPAVRVLASARGDASDQLDVRGLRAHEAREAVRSFVDDAALAGLGEVRIVHGRGSGAVRAAVRDELQRHELVGGYESDSSDGATLARLG